MNNNEKNKQKNKFNKDFKGPKNPKAFNFYWIYALIGVVFFAWLMMQQMNTTRVWGWKDLQTAIENNEVSKIEVNNKTTAYIHIKVESLELDKYKLVRQPEFGQKPNKGPHYSYTIGDLKHFQEQLEIIQGDLPHSEKVDLNFTNTDSIWDGLIGWLPMIVIIVLWIYIMRRMSGGAGGGAGGQIFNIGKSKAQLFEGDVKVNTNFKDVAGLEGAKEEVQEIVNFLKNPDKYTKLGGKIPKGALLVGPPGTGKTLLAKAVAGEADVPFYSLSGSDFVEMFVGVGASRVRDLFKKAKEKSPSIIFIDEIDAIGRARGKSNMTGGNDERENTLNQLLTEMDGFGTDHHVIVLAATNRADVLDKALIRAGRFDRQIFVDLPELNERKEIFLVHLRPLKHQKNLDIDFLAKQTPGFSGADIANLCNEAALIAARQDKKEITKQDFLDAVDRIIGGLEKKNKIISKNEKLVIAHHEAGHAMTSWLLEHAAPLVKVTIVPRGRSLGAAWYLPEERQITTTEQILDEMCATLGGRAAEKLIFNKISTGALSDLEKVTKQAQALVTIYGLSDRIGNISYYDSSGQNSGFLKPYSEHTAQIIDEEISKIIESAYQRALDTLSSNLDGLKEIAKQLLEKEVIFKEDLETILGARPWKKEEESEKKEETTKSEQPKEASDKEEVEENNNEKNTA